MNTVLPSIVTEAVAEKLLGLQRRCIVCGSTYALQIHHRVFKSEGEDVLKKFLLEVAFPLYSKCYLSELQLWSLNSIQNLCVLCNECHEGCQGRGIHGGNEKLRQQLRNSFTCPATGFNIPFVKNFNY